ncbi:hypothetical protein TNIN_20261 [Trichonephila inaurata madagascariensis]|uniref:Uncharacterized protein n=1 Tax=Trichonephila inaurata madagascariensis TaxID=2747483 RepID=A0A8X6XAG1_9ARAC|nr:hypothetical protein TNIN_20261 [Trichonephila inaurata madagascariensis]
MIFKEEMAVDRMLKGREPEHKKFGSKRIKEVKLNYSTRKELYEEMRSMVEENISVKEKKVTQSQFSAQRICTAQKLYVVLVGAKVVYFLDTPTKIERLSKQKYSKLNQRMKQMLFGIGN